MPLTEFDLIEISRRFRLLEDAIAWMPSRSKEQRANIDVCLEACRDDMVAMQSTIRQLGGVK